jgi:hypothetical protein
MIRFVEDNWHLPRIAGSYDSIAGSLDHMFNFGGSAGANSAPLLLRPTTGQPAKKK